MKTAKEIMEDVHLLDDEHRAGLFENVQALNEDPAKNKGLAVDIAALPEQERAGVMAALDQDFNADGSKVQAEPIPADDAVGLAVPSHPSRWIKSLPEGIRVDEVGKAQRVDLPPPDAALQASISGVPDQTRNVEAQLGEEETDEEKANPKRLRGRLPEDFTARTALEGHDPQVTTYAQLRKLIASGTDEKPWYKDVNGIGEANAAKIEEAFAAESEK